MDQPSASVIIPVKNGESYLAQALTCTVEQDYASVEIIVVDGQSTDSSARIAKSFERVKYVYQDTNPSLSHARNVGIDQSEGDYIAFLSADDLWPQDKLSTQIGFMIQHPEIQYTIARVSFFLEPGCALPPGFRASLLHGDYVGSMPETLVARRQLFDTLGRFNPDLDKVEDIDWFARARDGGVPSEIVDRVLLYRRVHSDNLSHRTAEALNLQRGMLRLLRRSIDRKRHRAHSAPCGD